MSTAAIAPIDFAGSSATASEQTVFTNVLNRLEQTVSSGDLTIAQALLNTINVLSPSSATGSTPLGTFLTGLSKALKDKSPTEAQRALATYQKASAASPPPAAPAAPTNSSATAAAIASQLIKSQNQFLLANAFATLLTNAQNSSTANSSSSNSPSNSVSGLYSLLDAAYGKSGSSSTPSSTVSGAPSATPYDALVSSIQASLAAGHGTITPALAYLQATGNFVNTSA
jgi:hypothetical protein